jgi:glutamyl endopeptidase
MIKRTIKPTAKDEYFMKPRISESEEGNELLVNRGENSMGVEESNKRNQLQEVNQDKPVAGGGNFRELKKAERGVKGELEVEPKSPNVKLIPSTESLLKKRLLDAWHGTYSDAVKVAQLREQPRSRESSLETIIAGDDRIQIENTYTTPWRWICSLMITSADGSNWVGTGWFAGPRTIITAGHCVFLHKHGGWAAQVEVLPSRNGESIPYRFTSTDLRSVEGWILHQNPECDYGAIILPESVEALGCFGYQDMTDEDLAGLTVNVYGYPADKEPGTLWGHARVLEQSSPRTLVYDIDTFGGQSGCPVYYKKGSRRYVVGIHNYGDVSGNSATRITASVFDNIQMWKEEL